MRQNDVQPGEPAGASMLLDLRDGIYADDLVIAAVAWLDLFTALATKPLTLQEAAAALGVAERPLDVLLTLLTALDLVERRGDAFAPSAVAEEYLVRGRPRYLGPFFASQGSRPTCLELVEVLKKDQPAGWSSREGAKDWESSMSDEPFSRDFTAAMDARGAVLAPAMARAMACDGYTSVLDIAGGSGIYACSVVEEHPHMHATVLEKPPVDRAARASIADKGFADRVSVVATDMFSDDLPGGFDVHLWSHVLHDWGQADVRLLLSKSFDTLNPGGAAVIHDAHLDADKSGPLSVARFSVTLMHSTRGKCYSVREMREFLAECGFVEVGHADTVGNRSVITALKPG